MAKQQRLFSLIKSLNKAEKRHFRLMANVMGRNSNYLKLFDLIDKQKTYDEAAIKACFAGETFIKQLHVTKNYLYQLILKSLRSYHARDNIDAELRELLAEVDILFRKELLDHCGPLLDRAEELATQYEKYIYLLDILAWQRKLLLAQHAAYEVDEPINTLLSREQDTLNKINTLQHYWSHAINIFKKNSANSEVFREDPFMQDSERADSLQAKTLFYHIRYSNQILQKNVAEAEQAVVELVELLEQHPHRIRQDPSSYVTAINNHIGILLHTQRFADIPPLLNKIRTIPTRYKVDAKQPFTVKNLLRTYNVELEMYRDTGQAEAGIALVDDINGFLDKHKTTVPREYYLLFYYQFAYLYFLKGNYKQSLHWLNTISKENFTDIREDIQSFARLLTLINHFELDHIGMLKYAVDATRRFLKKKRDLQDYEKTLLNFFSRLSLANPAHYQDLFTQLYEDLFSAEDNRVTESALDFLDFKNWIEKRAEMSRLSARTN